MEREIFDHDHDDFRASVRRFVADEISPNFEKWEEEGLTPREVFKKAGEKNMLAMNAPEEYGGLGIDDFRFNQVIAEEGQYAGATGSMLGITLHVLIRGATFNLHTRKASAGTLAAVKG